MEKKVLVFLFSIIVLSGLIGASTFTVKTACSIPENKIMGLSDLTNAHGELWGQNNYDYELCANFAGDTNCEVGGDSKDNKIIGLSDPTNAHGEIPENSVYLSDVCFADLRCVNRSDMDDGGCRLGYSLKVLSLSSETNAHIAEANIYDQRICCYAYETPIGYVEDPDGGEDDGNDGDGDGEIEVVAGVSFLHLFYKNVNVPGGTEVTFTIFKRNIGAFIWGNSVGEPIALIDSIGEARTTWLIPDSWTEGFYEIRIIVSIDFEGVPDLIIDIIIEVLLDDFCDIYLLCNDYGVEYCASDICELAVPQETALGTDCNDEKCYCVYKTLPSPGSCVSVSAKTGFVDGVRVITEECVKTATGTQDPDEAAGNDVCADGFISFFYTYSCADDPTHEFEGRIACPSQVELPFFGFYNFVVTMLVIALMYYFISVKEHRRKK